LTSKAATCATVSARSLALLTLTRLTPIAGRAVICAAFNNPGTFAAVSEAATLSPLGTDT
jgi:hypothetical protein